MRAKKNSVSATRATGKTPERIFDIQLASAFAGLGYPQSLTSLTSRILNQKTVSKEQRTDWSKRPLTQGQYNYAADDVRYLYAITCELRKRLEASNRLAWLSEEQASLRQSAQLRQSLDPSRVAGSSRLSAKQYVVLGALVAWRAAVAERVNRPIRTVVRDDVLVELARRQPKDLNELRLTRGLQLRQNSPDERELLAALQQPQNGAQADYPRPMRVESPSQPWSSRSCRRLFTIVRRSSEWRTPLSTRKTWPTLSAGIAIPIVNQVTVFVWHGLASRTLF